MTRGTKLYCDPGSTSPAIVCESFSLYSVWLRVRRCHI